LEAPRRATQSLPKAAPKVKWQTDGRAANRAAAKYYSLAKT
jgi:hypothetical protein